MLDALWDVVFLYEVWKLPKKIIKKFIDALYLLFFVVLTDKRLNLFNKVGHVCFRIEFFHDLGTYPNGVHQKEFFGINPLLERHDSFEPKNSQLEYNLVLLNIKFVLSHFTLLVCEYVSVAEFETVQVALKLQRMCLLFFFSVHPRSLFS